MPKVGTVCGARLAKIARERQSRSFAMPIHNLVQELHVLWLLLLVRLRAKLRCGF